MELLLLLSFLFTSVLPAQSSVELTAFLEKNYNGTERQHLEDIYHTIQYPAKARYKCIVGKSFAKLIIDGSAVKSVELLNELGYGLDKEVEKAMWLSDGKWKADAGVDSITISFAFKLEDAPADMKGDITVIGYTANGSGSGSCVEPSVSVLASLMEDLKNKRFKKADKKIDELLRRDAFSDHYGALKKLIEQNLE